MTKIKKEFVIEFMLFDKRIRTHILAESESEAKEKLFAAIRSQTKIEFIVAPKNEWNEAMDSASELFNFMGRFSKPNLQ